MSWERPSFHLKLSSIVIAVVGVLANNNDGARFYA